jgi:hypothetical protein
LSLIELATILERYVRERCARDFGVTAWASVKADRPDSPFIVAPVAAAKTLESISSERKPETSVIARRGRRRRLIAEMTTRFIY